MRERQYQDSNLANLLKTHMTDLLHLSDREVSQKGGTVYLKYGSKGYEEEYVAVFRTEGEKRFFNFHIENPSNNLLRMLKEEFMTDKIFDYFPHLKKRSLRKYKDLFRRVSVREDIINYGGNKEIKTAMTEIEIKEIPLGKKGHLSGIFIDGIFNYNIRPFILTVQKHKSK